MSRPRTSLLFSLFALSVAVALSAFHASATPDFPVPSPYPISWELKFKHGLPTRIVVDVPNSKVPLAFWYMTYTVTNEGDKELQFLPKFEMLTDTGDIVRSDVNIPRRVFDNIKIQEHNKFLEPVTSITGSLRLGAAEARDGVAIWPEPLARMGHFSIFATGLSGEAVTMKLDGSAYKKVDQAEDMKEMKDLVILRKTLQLNFFIRGDEVYPGEDQVNQDVESWIMR